MKNLLANFCLLLIASSISLAGIEVAYRISLGGTPPAHWYDRPKLYFNPANSVTLQAQTHQKVKPDNVFRIAVAGDSYSFAPFMQFDDAFPKRLERLLNLNSSQRRGEVVNYGVPGYSTAHEVKDIEHAVNEEGADLVILQITLNDPEYKPFYPTGISVRTNPYGALVIDEKTNPLYHHWKSLGFVMSRLHNSQSYRKYTDYFFGLFKDAKNVGRFHQAIRDAQKICADKNVRLVAVVFPLFGVPIDDSYPFQPIHQAISEFLDTQQISHLDLTDIYRGIPVERIQVMPGEDFHPNEIAHRMAAEEIYRWLISQKLIPEELIADQAYRERTQILLKPELKLDVRSN